MQGAFDTKEQFLGMSIGHLRLKLAYLAFVTSAKNSKFKMLGFLSPGLVIYEDNAYVSNNFIATLYENAGKGSKDAYDFYHSQVRFKSSTLSECLLTGRQFCGS